VPRAPVARTPRSGEPVDDRCLDLDGAKDTSFVIIHGNTLTMCGDKHDVRAANRARSGDEDLLWFRVDGQDWVIRNPSTIAQALDLFQPESELDRRMETLDGMQEELSRQQERLGEEEGKLSEARDSLDDAKAEDGLSRRLEAIGRQLEGLDRELTELDSKQSSLADEASVLAAEAQTGMSNVLRDAMANGVARRLL
jgi:chromosome segregation ATPase